MSSLPLSGEKQSVCLLWPDMTSNSAVVYQDEHVCGAAGSVTRRRTLGCAHAANGDYPGGIFKHVGARTVVAERQGLVLKVFDKCLFSKCQVNKLDRRTY